MQKGGISAWAFGHYSCQRCRKGFYPYFERDPLTPFFRKACLLGRVGEGREYGQNELALGLCVSTFV
jgi:hypothetical protein